MDDIRKAAERIVRATSAFYHEHDDGAGDRRAIRDRYGVLSGNTDFLDAAIQARVEFAERVIREMMEPPLSPDEIRAMIDDCPTLASLPDADWD